MTRSSAFGTRSFGRPMLAAVIRALPVGLAIMLCTRTLPKGDWWWRAGVLGVLNIGAFFALLFVAAFRLPGGVTATAGALQPVIAAGIAAVLLGASIATSLRNRDSDRRLTPSR